MASTALVGAPAHCIHSTVTCRLFRASQVPLRCVARQKVTLVPHRGNDWRLAAGGSWCLEWVALQAGVASPKRLALRLWQPRRCRRYN